jgi:hypothetical protein
VQKLKLALSSRPLIDTAKKVEIQMKKIIADAGTGVLSVARI